MSRKSTVTFALIGAAALGLWAGQSISNPGKPKARALISTLLKMAGIIAMGAAVPRIIEAGIDQGDDL